MTNERAKEIEALRQRLAALEAELEREKKEKAALDEAYKQLVTGLESNGLSMEAFVRSHFDDFKKIVAKIERQEARRAGGATRGRGRRRKSPTISIKIPAGKYKNIPSDPDKVFVVKEKGPRPKALKEYAAQVGLDTFMEQCRVA